MRNTNHSASPAKAWFITGPTSGIGHRTALQLAKHGSVVLVGRDPNKLRFKARSTRSPPAARYRSSATSPTFQVRGARPQRSSPSIFRSPACSTTRASCRAVPSGPRTDGTIAFATNQLGPFAFTEALVPYLPDDTNIVFICSGAEDPTAETRGRRRFPRWALRLR
jgi:NAD(P)-dependent dehydrogenase (short-subunit alcohol dehydrogenase family)